MAKPIIVEVRVEGAEPAPQLFDPVSVVCICGMLLRAVVGGGTARCACGQAFEAVYR